MNFSSGGGGEGQKCLISFGKSLPEGTEERYEEKVKVFMGRICWFFDK